jgi:Right handed beta helix region
MPAANREADMAKLSISTCIAATAIVIGMWTAPAQALVVRAWVSGHGNDVAGCGAPTNPCRTLQYTHDNIVAAGGEIDILDPAGYGTLNITKAISIVNDGVGTAGVQTNSGTAITINAGPTDAIYLRGLNIDGLQTTGYTGIDFASGGDLTVVNCVVRNFSLEGLHIHPTAGTVTIGIYDSLFMGNDIGIEYEPLSGNASTTAIIDHVRADKNIFGGIGIDGSSASSSRARFTISYSTASNNGGYGVSSDGAFLTASVEINNTTLDGNASFGLWAIGASTAYLARSVLDYNGADGVNNETVSPGGLFTSGDNHMEQDAGAAINGPAPTTDILH